MKAIDVDEYIRLRVEFEPNINVKELRKDIHAAIRSKLEGYRCHQCRGELWAVGTVIFDEHICYDCIGLESNSDNDIEFEIFLEKVY